VGKISSYPEDCSDLSNFWQGRRMVFIYGGFET